jgi:hypothetical protein
MSKYTDARDELNEALNFVTPDGPEWVKTRAAIVALDEAEVAEIRADFINASRRLDDAVAKLRAIVSGLAPNPASQFLSRVTGVLSALAPVVSNVEALLSGEPATALPGMAESNRPAFPTATAPIVPPVRERSRTSDGVAAATAGAQGVEQMIDAILQREGGFVDHASDRGGPTNFGVTLRSLAAWRKRDVALSEVRDMTIAEAREIYRSEYCTGPKIDKLPALLQPIVFDMSLNHGPGTAIKLLQQVLNETGNACAIDGGIGEETLSSARAAATAVGDALIDKLVARRIAFYNEIVAGDASQAVFLRGWLIRANEFRAA